MFGAVLNRLATSVRRALSDYSVGNQEPNLALDFVNNKYITNSSSKNFSNAVTHSRSGNATMTDGYGPELVTNGGFDSDTTGWVSVRSAVIGVLSGRLTVGNGGTSYPSAAQSLVGDVFEGKTYVVTMNVTAPSTTNRARVFIGDSIANTAYSTTYFVNIGQTRTLEFSFTATAAMEAGAYIHVGIDGSAAGPAYFDNVSVREMPVLKWAPHNLLTYSEDLTNGAYNKAGANVTADQITAPDGTMTADLLTSSATTAQHQIQTPTTSFVSGEKYTNTWFVKSGTHDYVQVLFFTAAFGSNAYANFDLSTGAAGTVGSAATASITDVGDDWYRLEVTADVTTTASTRTALNFVTSTTASRNETWGADGTETVYVWGAHLYRSDLGGMVDNPDRGDSYVPTALRPTGPNLITNGTFDTDTTGWAGLLGASLSVVNGALRVAEDGNDASTARAYQSFSTVVGKVYEVKVDYVGGTSDFGEVYINNNTNFGGAIASDASIVAGTTSTLSFVATATTTYILLGAGPASEYSDYDNVSVRESTVRPDTARYLPRIGHHVYNGSAWVNEGLLAESEARTNLMLYSEDFSQVNWDKNNTSITSGTAVSPTGLQTADTLTATSTGNFRYIERSVSLTQNETYTFSVYLKYTDTQWVWLLGETSANTFFWFDIQNGVIGGSGGSTGNPFTGESYSHAIQDVGNGWYRCSITFTKSSANAGEEIGFGLANADVNTNATLNQTCLVYGPQIEVGATPSSYIPTTGAATVTRPAETFTIPSANLPWPSPNYIGSELVTNGTFDTDSDWTKGTGWTISGGVASRGAQSGSTACDQAISLVAGKVYSVTYTLNSLSGGNFQTRFLGGTQQQGTTRTSAGTYEDIFVALSGNNTVRLVATAAGTVVEVDNVSVREIDPLSVSIAMDGRMNFVDENSFNTIEHVRWYNDGNNFIRLRVDSFFGTGNFTAVQKEGGTEDSTATSSDYYSDGLLIPYDFASRNGSTFINGAVDGVTLSENTTPTALPDLSATDLNLAHTYMGTIGTFRVWDRDIGDTGLVEATNPSLEPSLSLTFEGTGTNSFVVNDWSE